MVPASTPSRIRFLSKADTLAQFRGLIPDVVVPEAEILTLADWRADSAAGALARVAARFAPRLLAIRSSARCEDGASSSHAGEFTSLLRIPSTDTAGLRAAVEKVFASYPHADPADQVLVQPMVGSIDASGVILTRCVDDGSPYYVLSYDDESGSTDSVTSGRSVHKTVLVFRHTSAAQCDSPRVRKMLALARAAEELCGGIPLDLEFALDQVGVMHLLQVRRISTAHGWHPDAEYRVARSIPPLENFFTALSAPRPGLLGRRTVLGNMPDWNPAELIGIHPAPLAASLYRELISRATWSEARATLGYRSLPRTELMCLLGGRPFIDVRASFNSFLPADLPDPLGTKLVEAWIDRLDAEPSLHDKVEFGVAQTALDFTFAQNLAQRYPGLLTPTEADIFRASLRALTARALDLSAAASLPAAQAAIALLAARQSDPALFPATASPLALAGHLAALLADCQRLGTLPFSILARHAFLAESLLRSAVVRGALLPDRLAALKSSFPTVASELAEATRAVLSGTLSNHAFFERFGHLRPGTFDILSPCYRDRADLFAHAQPAHLAAAHSSFSLTAAEHRDLVALLAEAGLDSVSPETLLTHARLAIQGREYAKFVFTRHLSAILENLARWGAAHQLGREDLSFLALEQIFQTTHLAPRAEVTSELMAWVDQARLHQSLVRGVKLSYLIRSPADLYVVPVHRSEPNFITTARLEAPARFLRASATHHDALQGHIVCIENADPGFDWIFTQGLVGLVTKYGGANSHMAIRCAELRLPAAIGCGEELFERLRAHARLELDAGAKILRPVSA